MAFEGQRTSKLLTHAPATNAQVRVCTLTHPTKPHNVGASKQSCCQREKVWQQPGHTELQQQLGPLPAAVQRLAMCPGMQARLQARRRVLYTLSVDPNNRQQFDPNNLTSGAKRRQAGQPTLKALPKGGAAAAEGELTPKLTTDELRRPNPVREHNKERGVMAASADKSCTLPPHTHQKTV